MGLIMTRREVCGYLFLCVPMHTGLQSLHSFLYVGGGPIAWDPVVFWEDGCELSHVIVYFFFFLNKQIEIYNWGW